jgi:hypothetical protein
MRPHLEWHNDPDRLKRYIGRLGDEAIGGTIPNFGNRDLFKRLRELNTKPSDKLAYLHMTLSLPKPGINGFTEALTAIIGALGHVQTGR